MAHRVKVVTRTLQQGYFLACAVLHNVAQDVGLSAPDEELENQEIGADPEGDVGPLDARALRERIAARHF